MTTVGIAEAKAKLSSLLERVAAGEVVTITKNGIAVARLVPTAYWGDTPIDTQKMQDAVRLVPLGQLVPGRAMTVTIGATGQESTPAPRNPAPTHPSPPKTAAAPQRPGMTFIELLQKVAK